MVELVSLSRLFVGGPSSPQLKAGENKYIIVAKNKCFCGKKFKQQQL